MPGADELARVHQALLDHTAQRRAQRQAAHLGLHELLLSGSADACLIWTSRTGSASRPSDLALARRAALVDAELGDATGGFGREQHLVHFDRPGGGQRAGDGRRWNRQTAAPATRSTSTTTGSASGGRCARRRGGAWPSTDTVPADRGNVSVMALPRAPRTAGLPPDGSSALTRVGMLGGRGRAAGDTASVDSAWWRSALARNGASAAPRSEQKRDCRHSGLIVHSIE